MSTYADGLATTYLMYDRLNRYMQMVIVRPVILVPLHGRSIETVADRSVIKKSTKGDRVRESATDKSSTNLRVLL